MPDISVVIPTYNRPRNLEACLASLARQSLGGERFEVVVVDDGGHTDTASVIGPFRDDLQLQLLRQDNAGPASARNTGIARARGRFIALTDDDCEAGEHWLESLLAALEADPAALVGGDTRNRLGENIFSQASQALVDYLFAYFETQHPELFFFTTNNLAVSREAFLEAGGFDRTFPMASAEDREFCDRWIHQGRRMLHLPGALVFHSHRLSMGSYIELHYRYGKGARSFWQRRTARGQAPNRVLRPGFYRGLLAYPWKARWERPLILSLLLAVSQLANAAGYASTYYSANRKPAGE